VTNVFFLPAVVTWLLPSAIGGFLISRSIRKYVKPIKANLAALVVTACLLICTSTNAQTLYGRLSIEGIGQNLYVQLQGIKNDTSFSLTQRLLPGMQKSLLFTESVSIHGNNVKGNMMVFGNRNYHFAGFASADSTQLQLRDTADNIVGFLEASFKQTIAKPDYHKVFSQLLDTLQQYLFNKSYLDSSSWHSFKSTLKQFAFFLQDDLEVMGAINREMRRLPFTHCSFTRSSYHVFSQMINKQFSGVRPIEYKLLNKKTAYLKITSFNGDGSNIAAQMETIIKQRTPNLIIDLRGNSGGGGGAVLQLVKYLSPVFLPAGALVTSRWFETIKRPPVLADYHQFFTFSKGSTLELIEAIKNNIGVVLAVIPSPRQYKGRVYLLTDSRTASACEPLVYALKQRGCATVVGEKTAGAMLSAGVFWLDSGYVLSLPVADYYTYDGVRLDKIGVQPSLSVPGTQALKTVLQMIRNKPVNRKKNREAYNKISSL
jgi:hypothetical protein